MPFSSSSLTSEASENRGGGWVKCCSGFSSSSRRSSPSLTSGSAPAVPCWAAAAALLARPGLAYPLWIELQRRRTDGLVRVLRALLGLVDHRRRGQRRRAKALGDVGARIGDRVVGQTGRVGTHIGDETDQPL